MVSSSIRTKVPGPLSAADVPWNPATSTTRPSPSRPSIRSVRTSMIRAFVCEVSVTMPACEPVSETAS
jgi:hypothetical protein